MRTSWGWTARRVQIRDRFFLGFADGRGLLVPERGVFYFRSRSEAESSDARSPRGFFCSSGAAKWGARADRRAAVCHRLPPPPATHRCQPHTTVIVCARVGLYLRSIALFKHFHGAFCCTPPQPSALCACGVYAQVERARASCTRMHQRHTATHAQVHTHTHTHTHTLAPFALRVCMQNAHACTDRRACCDASRCRPHFLTES